MNILFAAPEDYASVGGINLPVKNYTEKLNDLGNKVVIFPMPYHINYKNRIAIKKSILSCIRDNNIDVIMTFGLNLSYAMLYLIDNNEYSGQKISYMVDSMRLFSVSRRKNTSHREYSLEDYIKECVYTYKERKCLSSYSKIIYVSNVDTKYVIDYYKVSKEKVYYVPNGTNIPQRFIGSKVSEPLRIGCLTGFSQTIIKDNLDPLVSKIFPTISEKYPNIKLVIAGKGAPEDYEKILEQNPNVNYLGFVTSLDEFYEKVDLVLTTVKKECGIINRVLEAWSYGKTVVGFDRNFWTFNDAENLTHYISADTPEDFLGVIDKVVANNIDIETIGKNAYELVKTNYTWDICARKLNGILEE